MTKVESEETLDTSVERTSHTCTCIAHACMVVYNTLSSSSYVHHAHLYVHSSNLTIKALVARRLVTYMYNVMYMTYCNIHIHVYVHVRLLEKLNHFFGLFTDTQRWKMWPSDEKSSMSDPFLYPLTLTVLRSLAYPQTPREPQLSSSQREDRGFPSLAHLGGGLTHLAAP